jgi:predicted ArsR family transcriptional regulator
VRHLERERQLLDDLPRLSVQILEVCRERGRVTVADAVKATGVSRNTIKDHLKALRLAGHIRPHGAGRGSWYSPA